MVLCRLVGSRSVVIVCVLLSGNSNSHVLLPFDLFIPLAFVLSMVILSIISCRINMRLELMLKTPVIRANSKEMKTPKGSSIYKY